MTISDYSAPSAPPPDSNVPSASVPVAKATPIVASAVPSSSAPAVPAGMNAKTVTTTYPDGRQVTTTEYEPAGASSAAAAAASSAPTPPAAAYHAPRRDLGARPNNVTCPYCNHTGKTGRTTTAAIAQSSV
eukprot:CAMPEP_0172551916 /NCGR_PEP_ID=MMETSP1067-20121228/42232_1 /TAXON_ID=265564 ORGANISM="Thalassiosira punctigera, Strain Tpunct2005C2" /NCGR_SAMPLE_ID=MMETSP1067 /ASSEMBLY_ACC=CAM_ASM_000444 /LENGTH=130 /DNA_ID=CAMNT_0013339783 /DNA_START=219 /DNA_END=612 /DNA_ORIENTATION=-